MDNFKRSLVLGGLTLLGVAVAGYRTYEIMKLRKAIQEEQVIDVTPEKVEEIEEGTRK